MMQDRMRIFFVVGAQKSGTTWLQRLLSGLPGVLCRGEGHFVDSLVMPLAKVLRDYNQRMGIVQTRVYQDSGEGFSLVSQAEFDAFCRHFIMGRLLSGVTANLLAVGDKTPANAKHLPTLLRLFPEARIVHIVRDGRDVAVSNYCHIRRIIDSDPTASESHPFAQQANSLLNKWTDYVESAESFRIANPAVPWLQVHYEHLLENPQKILQECADFLLDNPLESWQLEAAIRAASFEVLAQGRERGHEDPTSFLRKGIEGDWLHYFTKDIVNTISPKTLELLAHLGYII